MVIEFGFIESPIGKLLAYATTKGICLFIFEDDQWLEKEHKQLLSLSSELIENNGNTFIVQLRIELDSYFKGETKVFLTPLDMRGTDFQILVWNALKSLAYGEKTTYKKQAIKLNRLSSVRAVANANGANKLMIVVPCHRIIGTNGSLTGYRGGLWRKQFLLSLENKEDKSSQLALKFS